MNIIISGGDGRFSQELVKQNSSYNVIALSKEEMDITNLNSIESAIKKYKANIFIHTAALSRPMNVHDNYPNKSINLNIIGTANCVMACMKYNIKIVYISTDYVYPGKNGDYLETDGVYPVNKYAWSKLGGECSVMLYDNSLILRMAMMEYPFPHKKAFNDVYKSCIWHEDAAKLIFILIQKNITGIINVGGDKKSIYNFVFEKNNCILEYSKESIKENTPKDISMNIQKLKKIINNDTAI
jgi:dTDP-4-dehydrorhamnose reductase